VKNAGIYACPGVETTSVHDIPSVDNYSYYPIPYTGYKGNGVIFYYKGQSIGAVLDSVPNPSLVIMMSDQGYNDRTMHYHPTWEVDHYDGWFIFWDFMPLPPADPAPDPPHQGGLNAVYVDGHAGWYRNGTLIPENLAVVDIGGEWHASF